jgi:hypothetical protein
MREPFATGERGNKVEERENNLNNDIKDHNALCSINNAALCCPVKSSKSELRSHQRVAPRIPCGALIYACWKHCAGIKTPVIRVTLQEAFDEQKSRTFETLNP